LEKISLSQLGQTFSRCREKYVAENIRIHERIVLDCSGKICYCGWRLGKNCHINVVNSQVLSYLYFAHALRFRLAWSPVEK